MAREKLTPLFRIMIGVMFGIAAFYICKSFWPHAPAWVTYLVGGSVAGSMAGLLN